VSKTLELIVFTIEIGFIDGHGIDKRLELGPAGLKTNPTEILIKIVDARYGHSLEKAFINKVSLVIREHDPGLAVKELSELQELVV
jgi:hypothetical protein